MAGPTGASTGRPSTPARPTAPRRTAPVAAASPAQPVAAASQSAPAVAAPVSTAVAPVVPQLAAPAPADPAVGRDGQVLLFGAIVVVAGFVAILIALWLVVINYKVASDATAVLGIVTTAIAGLGGAVFGVTIGLQGTWSANRERAAAAAAKDEAVQQTIRFAAHMDPVVARRLVE
jgi:hypothetical protein